MYLLSSFPILKGRRVVSGTDDKSLVNDLSAEVGGLRMDEYMPITLNASIYRSDTLALGSIRTLLRMKLPIFSQIMRLSAWGEWNFWVSFGPMR